MENWRGIESKGTGNNSRAKAGRSGGRLTDDDLDIINGPGKVQDLVSCVPAINVGLQLSERASGTFNFTSACHRRIHACCRTKHSLAGSSACHGRPMSFFSSFVLTATDRRTLHYPVVRARRRSSKPSCTSSLPASAPKVVRHTMLAARKRPIAVRCQRGTR